MDRAADCDFTGGGLVCITHVLKTIKSTLCPAQRYDGPRPTRLLVG